MLCKSPPEHRRFLAHPGLPIREIGGPFQFARTATVSVFAAGATLLMVMVCLPCRHPASLLQNRCYPSFVDRGGPLKGDIE